MGDATTNFGPYRLDRLLARGGMGELYSAELIREGGFRKSVAIKRILPTLSDDARFVDRFMSEAQIAARLNHRNVVHVYDFGRTGATYFLAMEYVDGAGLRDLLATPIGWPAAVYVAHEALQGLAYAHGQAGNGAGGVVHRDISPGNLLVSRSGEIKLTDFGLARLARDSRGAGGVEGTCAYMAPEQARGEPPDARCDLFSLAATIAEAVCGKPPLDVDRPQEEMLTALCRGELRRASEIMTDQPAPLVAWLERALDPVAAKRFASAREMDDALLAAAREAGIEADPAELLARLATLASERPVSRPAVATQIAERPINVREIAAVVGMEAAAAGFGEPSPSEATVDVTGVAGVPVPSQAEQRRMVRTLVVAAVIGAGLLIYVALQPDKAERAANGPAANGDAHEVSGRVEPAGNPEPPPAAAIAATNAPSPAGTAPAGANSGATPGTTLSGSVAPDTVAPGGDRGIGKTATREPALIADDANGRNGPHRVAAAKPTASAAPAADASRTTEADATPDTTVAALADSGTGEPAAAVPDKAPDATAPVAAVAPAAGSTVAVSRGALAFDDNSLGAGGALKLEPGAHILALDAGGVKVTLRLIVAAENDKPLRFNLVAKPWADVTINGVDIGQTPVSGRTLARRNVHKIQLRANGAEPVELTLRLD